MNKVKSYSMIAIYYFFANLCNNGIAFLMMPIFTRILSTHDYGLINTYNSWNAILTMIIGMAFHMSIRTAFVDYKEHIDDFVAAITFFSFLTSLFFSIIIVIILKVSDINYDAWLVVCCLFQSFFSSIIMNYNVYYMMKWEYKKRTLLLIFPNLIITIISIVMIACVLKTNLYLGKILPSVFVNAITVIWIIFLIYRKSECIINIEYWKYALYISTPIIFHGLSLNILSQSDRIMLTSLVGATYTGVYSLVYSFGMITSVFHTAIEGMWAPWFIECLQKRKIDKINNVVDIYIIIMTFVTIGIILISPELMKLMAPKEYWHGIVIVPQIIISGYVIFLYSLYVNIEHFHKKTKTIAINTVLASILNIILNYILIPKYNIQAAANTTLVSYLVSFYLHYINAKKIEKDLFNLKLFLKPILLIFSTIVILYINITSLRYIFLILIFIYIVKKYNINFIKLAGLAKYK